MTHRGVSHYPIIGTLTRILYIYLFLLLISYFYPINLSYIELFFSKGFYKNHPHHLAWMILCLPIFISDLIHFLVDFFDSIKNGTKFSSYAHKPGIILEFINPKIMKYHKKALKSAIKNSKKKK